MYKKIRFFGLLYKDIQIDRVKGHGIFHFPFESQKPLRKDRVINLSFSLSLSLSLSVPQRIIILKDDPSFTQD